MKRLICASILCTMIFLTATAQSDQPKTVFVKEPLIVEDYDKFDQKTTVRLHPLTVKEGLLDEFGIYAGFTYPGQTFSTPKTVTLGFAYTSVSEAYAPRFDKSRDLILLLDGERVPLGTAEYDKNSAATLIGTMHIETMKLHLPLPAFARIANARTVEARLGSFEMKLEEKHMQGLRQVLARAQR